MVKILLFTVHIFDIVGAVFNYILMVVFVLYFIDIS